MDKQIYEAYLAILHKELIPAMGCTEPIAIAYASAIAKAALGAVPERVRVDVSGNVIKNVKSVFIPHTGSLKGIEAAAAAGIVAGDPYCELEVISSVTPEEIKRISAYRDATPIEVKRADGNCVFSIGVTVFAGESEASVLLTNKHTHVERVVRDGEVLFAAKPEKVVREESHYELLSVERIVEFADAVNLCDVREVLERQIAYNTAIAEEGLRGEYGSQIGKVLLAAYGDSVANKAKAYAAAGSDARMNGCELPVVINSGSGNQGMTASLPVIVYAKEMGVSHEELLRALVVSNLVTVRLKTGIGALSAYCGATSAGCGAAAGVTYLHGGKYREIAHTVVNGLAINSGVICDGAKASCAAKIASSVEAGLLGMHMYMQGKQFVGGDGIVTKGVENTIDNVSDMAREGMKDTDREIIEIMLRR